MVFKAVLVAVVLALVGESVLGQDPAEFCKSFIQCSQEADKARQECDKLIIIAMPSGNGSESAKPAKAGGDCASNVKNISELLIQKQTDQRQQQRDCLNSHLGEATFGGDKSRQDQCKKLSAAASSSKPKRQKRKVAKDEPAKNATAAIHGNGTSPAPAVKEEKEATNGSAAPQSTDYAAYAKCLQAAEVKAEQCKPIAACCSEIQTCDFEYKLSPLYHDIIQLQYDLFKQYRQCRKERLAQAEGAKSPK